MNIKYLDFEKSIAELEEKIEELRRVSVSDELNISQEIENLEKKRKKLTESVFSSLTPWQISQLEGGRKTPPNDYVLEGLNGCFPAPLTARIPRARPSACAARLRRD